MSRLATMSAMSASASCQRLRPSNFSAKEIDAARSSGSAGVSFSSGMRHTGTERGSRKRRWQVLLTGFRLRSRSALAHEVAHDVRRRPWAMRGPCIRATARPAIFGATSRGLREAFRFHFRRSEHDKIVGGEIIRALSKPVVVGCDPKHHRANCRIVRFGQRPHFFGSHAPVRWGFEEIIRVGAALASQNGLPKFTRKSLYHTLFGIATRQAVTRRANPREAFTAPREPPPALGSRRNNPRLESASP